MNAFPKHLNHQYPSFLPLPRQFVSRKYALNFPVNSLLGSVRLTTRLELRLAAFDGVRRELRGDRDIACHPLQCRCPATLIK